MSNSQATTADWEAMREILASIAIGPVGSRDLSRQDARRAMGLALSGEVSDVQIGAFLLAARLKRETTDENLGFLDALVGASTVVTADTPDIVSLADPHNGFTRAPHFAPVAAAVLVLQADARVCDCQIPDNDARRLDTDHSSLTAAIDDGFASGFVGTKDRNRAINDHSTSIGTRVEL